MITLSGGQRSVFDKVMDWHKNGGKKFVLAGYAGTGKSTLAQYIANEVSPEGTIFCAFTGKAANVLREKGCSTAGTLHRFLYWISDYDREILKQLESEVLEAQAQGNIERLDALLSLLEDKRAQFRKPAFSLNEDSVLKRAPLVIVDEFSMLSDKLIADLETVAKKILYLGDPFQLPPVEGICSLTPDSFLTEIHRQALDSPIIQAATSVRKGLSLSYVNHPEFRYQPKKNIAPNEYEQADQIIVGRNNTRVSWNQRFRQKKGYSPDDLPKMGEKMICLKNELQFDLFNGMIGSATSDASERNPQFYMMNFEDKPSLRVWSGDVMGVSSKYDGYNPLHRTLQRFDFGYAITAHKSQGSEFDKPLVYNEPIGRGEDARRWLYTSLTRGKKKVTLVEP